MTTIATDGRSIASDGQITSAQDYIVALSSHKIQRTASGRIVGCCGPSGDDELFIEWLENGGKKPRLGGSFRAVVLEFGEPTRVYFNDCTRETIIGNHAIGSGAPWALAAMDMGKTPAEAVAYACSRDIYSGGEIAVLSLETPLKAVAS